MAVPQLPLDAAKGRAAFLKNELEEARAELSAAEVRVLHELLRI